MVSALVLACLVFGSQTLSAGSLDANPNGFITFQSFKTHSRISFRVDPSVAVEWHETPTGFTVFFKGATLVDFGAPFGDEERWVASFSSFENPMNHQGVASLKFRETSGGVRIEGAWKFARGKDAPAEPRMESFSYREANSQGGPRFVADFWTQAGMTVSELQSRSLENVKELALKRAHDEIAKRSERRIASLKAKAELNDLTRFCSEPLADGRDIFLPLLPVHEKIDFVKFLPTNGPDEHYKYFRPGGQAKDTQYVRLALDLYRAEKFALAIRTLDFLDAEFPASTYRGDMHFLRANALIKLSKTESDAALREGLMSQGERMLEQVRLESKGMPPALYAALYLGAKVLEKNSPIAVEEAGSWLIQNYPGHPLSWLFHLAVAESLYDLEQTERATVEYQWVADKAPASVDSQDYRAVAAFRIGDLYYKRGQYEQALGAYFSALQRFPKQAAANPAFLLNRAEALNALGKYEEARAAYSSYLKTFAGYPEGWRATLRLAEIDARQSGDDSQKKSRQWFYETINRYPFSPGSTLARLRLLPCDDHGKFTAKSADRFFAGEAKNFASSPDVSREIANDSRYSDLRAQSRVRSLIGFGNDEAALAALQEERPAVQSMVLQKEFKATEGVLFRRMILAKLDSKKVVDHYAALKFYEVMHASAEEAGAGVDPDYLLSLSHTAANLGLGTLAQQFADKYRQLSSESHGQSREPPQAGRTVAEAATREGQTDAASDGALGIDEKLRVSDQRFAEAKALWIHNQDDVDGLKTQYDSIIRKLDQVVTESRYALEKEVILGLIEQRLKKPATALGHIAKAELLASTRTETTTPAGLRQIRAWLASVEVEAGDLPVALDVYRKIESGKAGSHAAQAKDSEANLNDAKLSALGVPSSPTFEEVMLAEGAILDRKARWGEAAIVYAKAVDQGVGGNQAKYCLARALLREGGKANRQKALSTLEKVSESPEGSKTEAPDFWRDLAAKTLENEQGASGGQNR